MSVEENRTIARRYFDEIVNGRDDAATDELRGETVVPPTAFLRYGKSAANRFLALPALRREPALAG
jgi:hypothetical protein